MGLGPFIFFKYFRFRTTSFGSKEDREPTLGSRSVLETIHFGMQTASFRSKQAREPCQGSMSVLKTVHF